MIKLETNFHIAHQSDDHRFPWGTKTSNSNHSYFRFKLLRLFDEKINWTLLDLGCSGGAFVNSLHEIGVNAVGIEGSDYSLLNRRGAWPKLGGIRLFTADIVKPFSLKLNGKPMLFDVITAWDVLEHLHLSELPILLENIHSNLKNNGFCIFTIATIPDVVAGVDLHKTILKRSEWEEIFNENGLEVVSDIEKYFKGHSARGRRINQFGGFDIVIKKKNEKLVASIPKVGIFESIADRFVGTRMQKYLKIILTGEVF